MSARVMIGGRAYGPALLTVGRDIYVTAMLASLNLPEILKDKTSDDEKRQAVFVKLATANKACEVLAGLLEEHTDAGPVPFSPEWAAETAARWGSADNTKDHEILKLLVMQLLFAFFGIALGPSEHYRDIFANWAASRKVAASVSPESLRNAEAVIAETGK